MILIIKSNWIKVIFINLCTILLSLELISLGLYGFKKQQFFYARSQEVKSTNIILNQTEDTGVAVHLDESLLLRLHPYFGYTDFKPDEPTINNYQFGSSWDYPVIKNSDRQYIIGIFGGAAALAIANTEAQDRTITNTLKQLPKFADKEIIILNFAQSGYKQPQQLFVFNYFLSLGQEFDMVINIDGLNEVTLSSLNYPENVHLSLPHGSLMKSLVNLGNNQFSQNDLEIAVKTREYNTTIRQIQSRQNACWFALCYLIEQWHYQIVQKRYQTFLKQQQSSNTSVFTSQSDFLNLFYLNPPDPDTTPENLYEKIAQTWANSSLLMHQNLASQNHLYFHFLQPNSYYLTQRQLTAEEQQQANPVYSEAVRQGYPLLIQEIAKLQENNVYSFNATAVFDTEPNLVYDRQCCHYNALGNLLFSQYIANSIVQTLQPLDSGNPVNSN